MSKSESEVPSPKTSRKPVHSLHTLPHANLRKLINKGIANDVSGANLLVASQQEQKKPSAIARMLPTSAASVWLAVKVKKFFHISIQPSILHLRGCRPSDGARLQASKARRKRSGRLKQKQLPTAWLIKGRVPYPSVALVCNCVCVAHWASSLSGVVFVCMFVSATDDVQTAPPRTRESSARRAYADSLMRAIERTRVQGKVYVCLANGGAFTQQLGGCKHWVLKLKEY